MAATLSPEQEAEAQRLVEALRPAIEDDLLHIARLLVSRRTEQLFGATEVEVRDHVHRIGAKAYNALLAQKKTAMRDRE